MNNIYFASLLEESFFDKLEAMMFFNPQQKKITPDIIRSLKRFGEPRIKVVDGYLIVQVGNFVDVQTLYALFDTGEEIHLAGMLIYVRTSLEELYILQLAVREEWSISGQFSEYNLTAKMITRLRDIARRLKGVKVIKLSYGGKDVDIHIKKAYSEG